MKYEMGEEVFSVYLNDADRPISKSVITARVEKGDGFYYELLPGRTAFRSVSEEFIFSTLKDALKKIKEIKYKEFKEEFREIEHQAVLDWGNNDTNES